MDKVTFGKTGLAVSRLGFGAAPVGFLPNDREATAKMLHSLLDRGVNFIDTAANYAGAEELIGETIGHRRGEFVLVSKCGHKVPDVNGEPWSAQIVTETVDRSLRRLRTDVLDVMLLHSCDLDTLKKGEALGALVKARQAGKVRFVGYSGDDAAVAHACAMPDVAVVEMSVNIADQKNIDVALPAAVKNNVGVIAKRPIANAAWKDLNQQAGYLQSYAKVYTERLQKMPQLKPSTAGFPDTPEGWAEMALRFTLSQPGVHVAIIGTTNPKNADANLGYTGRGGLSAKQVDALRAAFKQADPKGEWTGQT